MIDFEKYQNGYSALIWGIMSKDLDAGQKSDKKGGSGAVNADKKIRKEQAFFSEYLPDAKVEFDRKWNENPRFKDSVKNFDVFKILGSGSFGQVLMACYKGSQPLIKDPNGWCAIKMLKKENVIATNQVDHTINEKKISLALNSVFTVNVHYAFQDPVNLYLVMEFMPGGEFFLFMRHKSKFSEPWAQFYAAQVVLGLQYMHHMSIIYRDMKPENILIDALGYIKLADFGFAKYVPGKTWTLCGTPHYMAPEVLLNKSYGKSVDCWGLGILIYEMVAGYAPFDDPNAMKLYEKILAGSIKYPKQFSAELIDLLKSLIQADVTKRFGNLKNGMYDVMAHTWFKKVDFIKMHNRQYSAPWKPNVSSIMENFTKGGTSKLKLDLNTAAVTTKLKYDFQEF